MRRYADVLMKRTTSGVKDILLFGLYRPRQGPQVGSKPEDQRSLALQGQYPTRCHRPVKLSARTGSMPRSGYLFVETE